MPVVATNTAANTATRFLNYNTSMASSPVGKLASGSRIVRASHDAAGLDATGLGLGSGAASGEPISVVAHASSSVNGRGVGLWFDLNRPPTH